MAILLKGGNAFIKGKFEKRDVLLQGGRIAAFLPWNHCSLNQEYLEYRIERVIQCDDSFLLPGFMDPHVHFRQPGFEYKESILTGSMAAAAGGYTRVLTMPNLKPAPFDMASLDVQLKLIEKDAVVGIVPFGTITCKGSGQGALASMDQMADHVAGFTDDGFGIMSGKTMEAAMAMAAGLGKIIAAHCEDMELARQGRMREAEWRQLERDLGLVKRTGCHYHVCHVSTRESLALIGEAKAAGLPVTCETAPHYLLLTKDDITDDGKYKMNPPLLDPEDRDALLAGLKDGTVDMIATDHAPHAREEKNRGFEKSLNGIIGLETSFPVLYTSLVKQGKLSLDRLVDAMAAAPRKRFGFQGGILEEGAAGDIGIWHLGGERKLQPEEFFSQGRSTPFEGWQVQAENRMTIMEGEVVWEK